ncbi:hypothetical protein M378DRAFT_159308 [Amanita muscaria Koide BX008]|uniref:Uncharacterized protein n=1 Tax=Amanita muscaria (strain Koide BX008) TaxID=946122 RepID=A0A0C2TKJ3_AMAMK|nr:hypothetical protein M378DRAFT_159308 [Amanita muscaria Koide BX008]
MPSYLSLSVPFWWPDGVDIRCIYVISQFDLCANEGAGKGVLKLMPKLFFTAVYGIFL